MAGGLALRGTFYCQNPRTCTESVDEHNICHPRSCQDGNRIIVPIVVATSFRLSVKDWRSIRNNELAGVVAVEVTGGPEIPFHLGREDKPQPPPEGRLPDATKCYKEF
ncbi:unnamed protein product [Arabidopsis arenosa]|uniref:Uncharacterized protein n=1 Tax=Arabidopsis arenosa TaxID=38785 RepID=A0A8S2A7V0_ARAAE|nr:unnamed protein product [Arabidopsis arenosa]